MSDGRGKMKLPKISTRYFLLGVVFVIFTYRCSETVYEGSVGGRLSRENGSLTGTGVDSGADGGAIGFSILGAMCFYLSEKARQTISN